MVNTNDPAQAYLQIFSDAKPLCCIRAPGRVNLIGEHTDYNDGFVLPIAMSQSLQVIAGTSTDNQIAVHSTAFDETIRFSAEKPGAPNDSPVWSDYVRGVAALLSNRGIKLQGGRLLIHSEVPIGGGVSSSAALEIGSALALLTLAGEAMEPIELALLAQQAEHEYAHSPCGIMDQFICVLGQPNHALLLDCRSQTYEQLPLPFDEAALVILDTQVKHKIGSSEYPVRQQQCREGLSAIQKLHPDIASLRDVNTDILANCEDKMDPTVYRRCQHVVSEIARTQEAAETLRVGNIEAFGGLMLDSHVSLRDYYEVSCPELDQLVNIASNVSGVYGARMTGGGFGGCAIALARKEAEQLLRETITQKYDSQFDKPAIVYTTQASNGASTHLL